MTTKSIAKRLDTLRERKLDAEVLTPFIVMVDCDESRANGQPYQKPGESKEACFARYGVDSKRRPCLFLRLTHPPG